MALDNLSLDKPVPPFPDSVQTLALSPARDNYTHLKEGQWKKEAERFRRRLAQASLHRNKKETHMRNRKKQQELIKAKATRFCLEKKLDLHDYCGIKDPTPFEAVRNMIRRGESAADYRKSCVLGD